jgi:hypothetical protein
MRALLIFTLVFSSFLSEAQDLCREILFNEYFQGVPVKTRLKSQSLWFLGAGEMGGRVYRVLNLESGQTWLRKDYFDESSLENDVAALNLFQERIPKNAPVKVYLPHTVSESSLTFSDVKGYPLDKIPNRRLRKKLNAEFLKWADLFTQKLQDVPGFTVSHYLEDVYGIEFQGIIDGEERSIDLMLKPDNIIYDTTTEQMILFDPF